MSNLKAIYSDSKNYSNQIMSDVESLLKKKKIPFDSKYNRNELVIPSSSGKGKDAILKLLNGNLKVSGDIISVLLDVVEVSGTVYIRLKTK